MHICLLLLLIPPSIISMILSNARVWRRTSISQNSLLFSSLLNDAVKKKADSKPTKMPVTVISGFLGAGKVDLTSKIAG